MLSLIPVVFSSLFICFILTPFFRDFFGFLGIVDKPDEERKKHLRPTPRVGGVALVLAYFVALISLGLGWKQGLFDPHDQSIRLVARLSPSIVLIFLVGLCDDFWGLLPWQKVLAQVAAASYACWIGVRLAMPPGYTGPAIVIELLGILWLVLCTNAFNLIDGLDGLATGVALIASASLLVAALIHHEPGLAIVITPLVGALLGFLYYNFNPASVFLGDCGSLPIGFLLGCYGLMWNQHAHTGLGMGAPFVALALPVFEVMLSIVRRFIRNRPIFGSDSNHIHHRILSLGLSHRDAALVLYGVAALAAIVAILQTILRPQFATALLVLLVAAGWAGFRLLRYPEFGILGQLLFAGGLRRTLRTSIHLLEYEESLETARTVDECWLALKNTCREANFSYLSMSVNGRYFEDEFQSAFTTVQRIRISLSRYDEAIFGYDPGGATQAMLIAPLAERLQEKLSRFIDAPAWSGSESTTLETSQVNQAVRM
jgi:UDP-GlcNAc:undecaprenyl-phosphate GlcNAc-1-phosphate transferase